jgi:hypothetical protein
MMALVIRWACAADYNSCYPTAPELDLSPLSLPSHPLQSPITIMPRERSLSGTIPSMETSHDDLKDNTVIIGWCIACLSCSSAPVAQAALPKQYSVHREI